jgi:peroxiredoxin
MIPLDGEAPPPLALPRVTDGAVMRLADLRGRAVLVYFWATW